MTRRNDCFAYRSIDTSGFHQVTATTTCASQSTTATCAIFPGRNSNDNGATAYVARAMCQDGPLTAYVASNNGAVNTIGSTSGMIVARGQTWTQVGGPRQNNIVPNMTPTRLGAGPYFTNHSYYEYPVANDPMDLSTFSACAVFVPSAGDLTTTNIMWHDGVSQGSAGAQMVLYETGNASFWTRSGGVQQTQAFAANVPNLVCWGVTGSTCYLRQNKGTLTSNWCSHVPDTTNPARLGIHGDLLLPFRGQIVEFWFSSTTPSDSVFQAASAQVEDRGGIALP
jgi:hypothetical protein